MLKPELRKVHTVEEKPVELKPVLTQTEIVLKTNEPKPPKEDVKIGNLSSGGSPAPATVAAPANKVQTGGFGDPNGIPGPGNPNRAGNINRAGSPQLPGGPGYGNGSGGAQGVRGTVASEGPRKSAPVTGGVTASVNILSMPNPVYSDEGRTLRMEGDVVLEVVFLASGQVQVTRVVSGLGTVSMKQLSKRQNRYTLGPRNATGCRLILPLVSGLSSVWPSKLGAAT